MKKRTITLIISETIDDAIKGIKWATNKEINGIPDILRIGTSFFEEYIKRTQQGYDLYWIKRDNPEDRDQVRVSESLQDYLTK